MTIGATYEHHFVTNDGPIFQMIEDERGDIFWGYGHRDAEEFTDEVNRWLIHACGATVPDDLFAASQPVEHLWARYEGDNPDSSDHFVLASKDAADAFPVTRLWL